MESNYNRCINIKELKCQNLEYISCKSRKPFDTFLSIMIPDFEGTDDIFYNEENIKRIFKLFPKLIYYKLIFEKYHINKLYYEATVRKFENDFIKFEIKKARHENGFENYQKDIWCSKKRKKEILGNVEEIFINTRYLEQNLKKMFPSSYLFEKIDEDNYILQYIDLTLKKEISEQLMNILIENIKHLKFLRAFSLIIKRIGNY
jgi:hypothetical protein